MASINLNGLTDEEDGIVWNDPSARTFLVNLACKKYCELEVDKSGGLCGYWHTQKFLQVMLDGGKTWRQAPDAVFVRS